MQPLHQQRSRRAHPEDYRPHVNGWLSDRPTRYHPYAKHAVFYLVLFAAETALLGELLWSGATDHWPVWKIVSVLLANLFFALMVGNHHISRFSKHLAAGLVLAGLCMLILVALSAFITPTISGLRILIYAWACALLVNALHYYPSRRNRARRRY